MPHQRCLALGGVMNNRNETPLTRSSCCSSAIGQSPAPSCPPDICCSRWRKSPPSASSCSTAPWNRPVMCHQQPDCQNKNGSYFSAEIHTLILSYSHDSLKCVTQKVHTCTSAAQLLTFQKATASCSHTHTHDIVF